MNPYWGTIIKRDFTELLNLIGAPSNVVRMVDTDTGFSVLQPFVSIDVIIGENGPLVNQSVAFTIDSYFWDTASPLTPLGAENLVFGKRRLTDCLCIFLQRALCDPRVNETICFELDEDGIGASILGQFDICLVAQTLGTLLVDILSTVFELTLHLDFANSPDDFFLFLDRSPFDDIIKDAAINLAESVLNLLTLIPEVGECIRDLVLEVVRYLSCLILFFANYILGLGTLPWFLLNPNDTLPDTPNFITRTDESLNFFVAINKALIDRTNARSLINCLCLLINNGFPVPPIPCPTCRVVGTQGESILEPNPQPAVTKEERHRQLFPYGRLMVNSPQDRLFDPYSILNDVFGYRKEWDIRDEATAGMRMTPLRYYKPQGELKKGYNPFLISQMIWSNYDMFQEQHGGSMKSFFNARETRTFIQQKKTQIMDQWRNSATCKSLQRDQYAMQHSASLSQEQRQAYYDAYKHGKFAALQDGTCPSNTLRVDDQSRNPRFTLFPTQPPLASCGNPMMGIPAPPCYDLCCVIRSLLELLVHIVSLVARFFNGLIQGQDPNNILPGESSTGFGYFTGTFCDRDAEDIKPCFESDIIILVRSVVLPLKCLCEFINLVIPVLEEAPRGDLCCSIQRVGELIACIVQLLVNAINALAMGNNENPDEAFLYYKEGEFQRDIARVFVVVEGIAECICVFVRGVFPGNFFSEFTETIDFDPCCFIESILDAVINLVQLFLNIIISLATLASGSPESFCYWRVDAIRCVGVADFGPGTIAPDGTISTIGFVQDVVMVIKALLPTSNTDCTANCMGNDPGVGGVIPCVCQVINALLPVRPDPSRPVSCLVNATDMNFPTFAPPTFSPTFSGATPAPTQAPTTGTPTTQSPTLFPLITLSPTPDPGIPTAAPMTSTENDLNCMYVDFCCPLVKSGFALREGGIFAVEAFASLWQSWDPGYPEFFTAYIFCDETADDYGLPGGWGNFTEGGVPGDSSPLITPSNSSLGQFKCGKLQPVIQSLIGGEGIVNRCLCEYFQLLDYLLSQFFALILGPMGVNQWGNCFCGGNNDPFNSGGFNTVCSPPGSETCTSEDLFNQANQSNSILGAISYLLETIITAIVTLLRRLPDISYWSPGSNSATTIDTIEETWIYQFLGPIGDAACLALGNLICFLNSLFFLDPTCIGTGKRFLGGVVRWVFEVVIRVVSFIEGFFKQFLEEPETCDGGACGGHPAGGDAYGIKGDVLGQAIVALFSLPIDALIGDGSLSCSGVCVPRVIEAVGPCACYNLGQRFKVDPLYVGNFFGVTDATEHADWWVFNSTLNMCVAGDGTGNAPNPGITNTTDCPTATTCIPQPPCTLEYCIENQICIPAQMPTCGGHPGTPDNIVDEFTRFAAIDGVLLGFVRYLRCVAGPLGVILYPLEVIFSVVWQIAGAVLNFFASLLIFFFTLFELVVSIDPLGSAIRMFYAFAAVFDAFINIFKTPINVPPLRSVSQSRNSFAEFKAGANFTHANGNVLATIGDLLYDFDTDDCFDDLNACVCRNFDVPDLCTWTRDGGVQPSSLSTRTTILYVKENIFLGMTPCDHVIKNCADADMTWDNVPFTDKDQFVNCLEKRIKSERLAYVAPSFPPDYFYSHRGPLEMVLNLGNSVRRFWKEEDHHKRSTRKHEHARFSTRFPHFKRSLNERKETARQFMTQKKNIDPNSPIFNAIVDLDQIWFKYRRGYYHYLFDRGLQQARDANFGLPTSREALRNLLLSTKHLARVTWHQPYRKIADGILQSNVATRELFSRVMENGPLNYVKTMRKNAHEQWLRSPVGKHAKQKRERFARIIENTPLMRMYRYATTPVKEGHLSPFQRYWNSLPIVNHMQRVIDFQQVHRDKVGLNFFNLKYRYQSIKKVLWKRWTPVWTEEKLENWKALESFAWQAQERFVPGSTPKHKRNFLLNQQCRIVDDTIALTLRLVNYCAAGFTVNKPGSPTQCIGGDISGLNCTHTRDSREAELHHHTVRGLLKSYRREGDRPESDFEWKPMPLAIERGIKNPRLFRRLKNQTRAHHIHRNKRHVPGKVDHRVYRRTVTFGRGSGPTGTNLYDILVCFIEDLTGFGMSQDLDQIIMDVRDWFTNPTTDINDFPNVGFLYWVSFTFNCRYFENLDCGIGIGLEETLKIILKWYFLGLIVGAIVAPGVLGTIVPYGSLILFVGVVPAVAWHYSPQCWFMTPTIPIASLQIPIFPFPVSLPALPFCLWQELSCLIDKYIAPCYDFIIPNYLVNGPVCVPCAGGTRIDFVNCKAEVGVSDGIQNILFAGYYFIGDGFNDVVLAIASTGIGALFPGVETYLQDTLMSFTSATDSQQQRQLFCFWATLPAVALPIGVIALGGIIIGSLLFAFIFLGGALWNWLAKSPLAAAAPGTDSPWLTLPQDDSVPNSRRRRRRDPNLVDGISGLMESIFMQRQRNRRTHRERHRGLRRKKLQ